MSQEADMVVFPEDIQKYEEAYIGSDDYHDNFREFIAYQDAMGRPSDEQAFLKSDAYFDARYNFIAGVKAVRIFGGDGF